ncbi:MAG TPA: hypothetical protein VF401_04095 [Candidatus Saccharimonadales bacterium]
MLANATKSLGNNATRIDFMNATPENLLLAEEFTAQAEALVDEAFAQPIVDADKCEYTSS